MRTLALVLVVANVLAATWLITRPPAPEPAGVAARPLQAPPLVLAAEVPDPGPRAPEPVVDVPDAPADSTDGRQCAAIGPFGDRDAVVAARDRLLAGGLVGLPRAVDASQLLGYWVHTPPAESRDAVTALIERLRRAGIRDFYVVNDGEIRNAVSLGVFGRPDTAEQHAARMRGLGFDVRVGERRREQTAWWLEYIVPAPESAGAEALEALARGGDALAVDPRPCE